MNTAPTARTLALLLVLLVFTRLPALVHPKAIDDEQVYAVVAREMLHGGRPYLDAVERKPPLLFYVYAAVLGAAGRADWPALHAAALIWTLATMAVLGALAGRLWGAGAGAAAALLYGLFLAWGDYRNLAFNGEMLMNLPAAAAVAITLWPSASRLRPGLLLAGALVAVAFLLKQPAGITGLPLGLYLLLPGYRQRRGLGWGHSLLHGMWLTLGFLGGLGLAALWLRHQGILQPAIYWTLFSHQGALFGPLTLVYWDRALSNGGFFVLCTLPLVLAAALGFRNGRRGDHAAEHAALAMLLAACLLGVGFNGQFLYHYFLQLLPPLALLAAPYLGSRLWGPARRRGWRAALAGCAALYFVVGSIGFYQHRAPGAAAVWVRQHSAPGDRLFVWGQGTRETGLYLDADRRPASRFIASFPLTGHIFGTPVSWDPNFDSSAFIVPGAWDSLAADFHRHPPRYIIDTDGIYQPPAYPMARYAFLRDYLQQYREVARAADGTIYARVPGA